MSELGRVPVEAEERWLRLPRADAATACRVLVRRVGRSMVARINRAADVRDGSSSDREFAAMIRIRWAITGAENLTDAESGRPVKFTREQYGALAAIAAEAVYDALSDLDAAMVEAVAIHGLDPGVAEEKVRGIMGGQAAPETPSSEGQAKN